MRTPINNISELQKKLSDLQIENRLLKDILERNGISFANELKGLTEPEVTENFDSKQGKRIEHPTEITDRMVNSFFNLFWGRFDVYAKRVENRKTGKVGYYTQCENFWCESCFRKIGSKTPCSECPKYAYKQLTKSDIRSHLQGNPYKAADVIAVYPMLKNNMCRFLVFDFDNHDKDASANDFANGDDTWIEEVEAMREICSINGIDPLVERSRSGKGAHIWIFFEKEITAKLARRFGLALLEKGAEQINLRSFRFYDRMIPAQNELNDGELGNLIALPLQADALKLGNSAFVDKNWNAYRRQWDALWRKPRLSPEFIEAKLSEWSASDISDLSETDEADLCDTSLNNPSRNEPYCDNLYRDKPCRGKLYSNKPYNQNPHRDKPWKNNNTLNPSDVDGKLNITLANGIYIDSLNLKPAIQNKIRRMAAFRNPNYYKKKNIGNFDEPQWIYLGKDHLEGYIEIPRGVYELLIESVKSSKIDYDVIDERQSGRMIDVSFKGELREEQKTALSEIAKYDNGILQAAPGFGKTVVSSALIAEKKVSTLIILESSELTDQWMKTFEDFLDINEEFPEYKTKTGRIKKRKKLVGTLQGAHDSMTGIIDIAMAGSLCKKGEWHPLLQEYGMVIVDECHHAASETISNILKEIKAKYVYGVTATPKRSDGLEKINYMLIGPIRYTYTAKEKAAAQGIPHMVYPRFTRTVPPRGVSEKMHPNEAYELIRNNEIRDLQIISDVKKCIEAGRTPVILSRYKDHSERLYQRMKTYADNVFLMTGNNSKKEHRKIRTEMDEVPADKTMILIATGGLIGEGFDFPRLDTLIMATPVSFRSVVEQYAGRLNRDYAGKRDVIVYDYVDSHVPMFDNMYAKRLKAYKQIGYDVCSGIENEKQSANAIFDSETYRDVFIKDLLEAKKNIVISSPRISSKKINELTELVKAKQENGVDVTIVTCEPDSYGYGDSAFWMQLHDEMRNAGFYIKTVEDTCEHFAVIDQELVWYGNMNLLSKEKIEDSMMRVIGKEIAAELMELAFGSV